MACMFEFSHSFPEGQLSFHSNFAENWKPCWKSNKMSSGLAILQVWKLTHNLYWVIMLSSPNHLLYENEDEGQFSSNEIPSDSMLWYNCYENFIDLLNSRTSGQTDHRQTGGGGGGGGGSMTSKRLPVKKRFFRHKPELYALQGGHGMRDGRSETNIPPTTSLCGV